MQSLADSQPGLVAVGGGVPASIGVAAAAVLGPLHTTVAHRYLHMTDAAIRRRAPRWLFPYLFGHHFHLMRRLHGVHHTATRGPDGGTVANQIVPGSIGDRLLGTYTNGTPEQRRLLRVFGL